ncbi:MAG: hypothetical protein QOD93_6835, partial [Acetobacteraceae bacterium]|nr:hypothetical protein [Acetobacteraceae bacterium]
MSTGMSIGFLKPHRIHRSLLASTAGLTTRLSRAGLVTVAVLAAAPAGGNPLGGSVAGGSATIQGQGTNSVTINQSSQNTVINWQTFNIGQGETTTFNQPNSNSVALNRVIGGQGPSFLDGTLTANGRVFIINGDGILFGAHSSINTAGFLATTNNIRDADFMAGKYNFNSPGAPNASIVNLGSITATSGGFAALVAPGVRNAGTITAQLGTVSLAAGNAFTLDFYGDRLITLAVNDQIASAVKDVQTGQTLKSLVSNSGKLSANGGRVQLTAAAARAVVDSVINNTGVIEANSVGSKNGMIVLSAATGASKPKGAPVQTIKLAGQISAAGKGKGTTGGTVVVSGENIVLSGTKIDASGDAGGGTVLIGGDTGGGHPTAATLELSKLESFVIPTATTVSADGATVINASATGQGNGGKVVLWSDQKTTFAGTILAQGGASGGNGGFVETSGHTLDFTGGRVDTSAPKGKTGNWLLDPTDLTIDSAAASTISSNLTTTNVMVQTNADGTTSGPGNTSIGPGDISVEANINWTGNNTLTLSAYRNVNVNEEVTISNTGAGNLVMRADNSGSGNGTVRFFGGQVDFTSSTGMVSIYYNPRTPIDCGFCGTKYQNPTNYSGDVLVSNPSHLTAYMLVNNANDLATMGGSADAFGNISGNFALGKSFDATGFSGLADTTFRGLFDGNGGLGVNYTISNLTVGAPNGSDSYGLFAFIGTQGVVRNLNLANVKINAGADIQFIGALAGENDGTISNVAVLSGTVNGGTHTGIGAGGLVGQNTGTIKGSSANVTVTLGDSNDSGQINYAGGMVGSNIGTVTGSSATGNVRGGLLSIVGGLVGQNGLNCDCDPSGPGTITSSFASGIVTAGWIGGGLVGANNLGSVTQSYATGAVYGSGNVQIGGLVGLNNRDATIDASYATGSVTGTILGSGGGDKGDIASVGGFVGSNNGTITNSY